MSPLKLFDESLEAVWWVPHIIILSLGPEKTVPRLTSPLKLVDESHTFCDGLAEYMSDNQDFTVIGNGRRQSINQLVDHSLWGISNEHSTSELSIIWTKGQLDYIE